MRKTVSTQDTQTNDGPNLIDAQKTESIAGPSRWTLWRWEQEDPPKFPRSIKVGGKRLWVEQEVRAWVAARIAERR